MIIKSLIILVALSATSSSPLRKDAEDLRVLYDQRQEGEWNVHADLKNFVFLIIPVQSASTTAPATSPTLLDFISRAIPKRSHLKRIHHHKKAQEAAGEETMHFIESKTAPYHVDISRAKSHLAKLHPEATLPILNAEEIVIAKSPSIALVKDENNHSRMARAFVLTVPPDEDYKTGDKKNTKKDNKKKSKESTLKLLGAENEQCGPGLERDAEGVCRIIKN